MADFGPALDTKFCGIDASFNVVSFSLQFLQVGHRCRYRFPRDSSIEFVKRGFQTRETRAFEPTKLIINRAQFGLQFRPTEGVERPQSPERKCWPIRTEDRQRCGRFRLALMRRYPSRAGRIFRSYILLRISRAARRASLCRFRPASE